MTTTDTPGSDGRAAAAARASSEQSIPKHVDGTQTDRIAFANYSFSSPEFRKNIKQITAAKPARAENFMHMANSILHVLAVREVPALLKASKTSGALPVPELPALLRAPGQQKPSGVDQPLVPAAPIVPTAPAEQMEDKNKTVDPCTRKVVNSIPAPLDMPKAMDSVKERDPDLYRQIQAKVTDPRYTGELGNITVSTHDKKGQVNGCIFVQNVPYWESGPAAQALVDVNKELAANGKKLEADPLNGAGRSLAQEEAIVWRNSGLHAKVGKSNHGYGKAEDFKPDLNPDAKRQPWQDPFVNATLHAHGWRQGDSWGPLKNDLHHWSFVGPGHATDGHAPPHKPTPGKHHKNR